MTGKKPSSRNGRLRESSAGADGGHAAFLPVSRGDMESRGWGELDFLFVSGDAYVDRSKPHKQSAESKGKGRLEVQGLG